MNLLYCGDVNTRKGIALSLLSVADKVREPLHVWLMTMSLDLSDVGTRNQKYGLEKTFDPEGAAAKAGNVAPIDKSFAEYMQQVLQAGNPASTVTLVDATPLYESEVPVANVNTRFTPCCMLRLYADMVSPELPDRILYLDYDVLCRSDCTDYYYQDMEGYEYAATLDYYGKWFYSPLRHNYINSGVLLMNLAYMRRTGLLRSCRQLCRDRELFLPDQHALNRCRSSWKKMPARYNSQRRLLPDTVFHHFSTVLHFFPPRFESIKPWDVQKVHDILGIYEYDGLLERLSSIIKELNL